MGFCGRDFQVFWLLNADTMDSLTHSALVRLQPVFTVSTARINRASGLAYHWRVGERPWAEGALMMQCVRFLYRVVALWESGISSLVMSPHDASY